MKKILSILLFLMILCGCKVDEEIMTKAQNTPLKLVLHKNKSYDISIPAELQARIFSRLQNSETKWKSDPFTTFVPNTVLENEAVKINIMNSILVLSTKENPKGWKQYTTPIHGEHLLWIIELEKLIEQANAGYRVPLA